MAFDDNDFIKLLRIEGEEIKTAFAKASIQGKGTPQEVSDRRELNVKLFLKRYFPFPYRIAKGNIIDSYGSRSASIDTIILNPIHPFTVISGSDLFSLIIADGVDAAIEIKPNLIGEEIDRSLKQGVTVKNLRRKSSPYVLKNKYTEEQIENSKLIPFLIFSNETYSDVRTLIERIVAYYTDNQTPSIEQFDFICINNRHLVINYRKNYFFKHNQGFEGIAIIDYGEDTLAAFLLWLNMLPGSVASMDIPPLIHYFKDNIKNMRYYTDLNKKLLSINH